MPALLAVLLINLAFLPSQPVLYESSSLAVQDRSLKAEIVFPLDPKNLVEKYAIEYKVSQELMEKIIQCESNWKVDAVNSSPKEYSVGISQINLKAHPHISEEQAKDPEFAIKFLASNLAQNKGKMWTCYPTSKNQ